jgi:hypothetical protein
MPSILDLTVRLAKPTADTFREIVYVLAAICHQRVYSYKCALEGRVQSRALLLSGAHGTWHQKGAI